MDRYLGIAQSKHHDFQCDTKEIWIAHREMPELVKATNTKTWSN
ncbi:MAG: hypothetical protein ACO3QB_13945 [bacterium]